MTAWRLPSLLMLLAAVLSDVVAAEGSGHVWSKLFGDTSAQSGQGVAVDGAGNVVVAGHYYGTLHFGGGPLTSAGQPDIFVAKFDPSGNYLWGKSFGDATAQAARSVAVDGSGNVIVTGFFNGTVSFGVVPLVSAGGADIFLVKFDAGGNFLWGKRFGDANTQEGYRVAVGTAGSLIVTGFFQGSTDFGGGSLASAGQQDIFLAKYAANGTHLWSRCFGDTTPQYGRGLAIDGSGNVTMVGDFNGTVDFGGGALTSAGNSDVFLARYDPNGNHVWSRGFGDANPQRGLSLAGAGSGSVVVTGDFEGTVDFGSGPLTSAGAADIFLAKYDSIGNAVWSEAFGGSGTDAGRAIAVDVSGNAALTGSFEGTVDFGGGPLVSPGGADTFVARYGPNGEHLSSERFGDASHQFGRSVAIDALGNALLAGDFQGTIDFGGGPLTSAGGDDVFLAKFSDLIFKDGFEV